MIVAMPFFSFPKVLVREKEKIRLMEKAAAASGSTAKNVNTKNDTGYGKDIKGTVQMYNLSSIVFAMTN